MDPFSIAARKQTRGMYPAKFRRFAWCFLRVVVMALPLSAFPAGLIGQTVRGQLFDAETGAAVLNGTVALRDSLGAILARAGTDSTGAYSLAAPGPGMHSLVAVGMGYRTTPTGQFSLAEDDVFTMDIFLYPAPIKLEPLTVEAKRELMAVVLRKQGFYDRRQQGAGSFLTHEQISRWPAISVGDVLRHAPFVYSDWSLSGSSVYISKGGRKCAPAIYVDGNMITSAPEHWVSPEDIVGVEVFRGEAEIPLQWASFQTCGVILIWTARGGGPPNP
jgi:hypothetical protein